MNHIREIARDMVIVFPDEGAEKRFAKEFPNHETIVLSKKREGGERVISLKEGNPEGKDLLLVDDLIQSGGTLIRAAEFLRKLGATSVSGYATHGVFPGDSHKKLAQALDMLYVTDSIPENNTRAQEVENMKIISLQKDFEKLMFAQ
jgi:phosphoribosylpyrophosphate synthetase